MRASTVLLVTTAAIGCDHAPTPPLIDPRVCRQTSEFANYGCADVTGVVLGSAGQPLDGLVVGPRYSAGGGNTGGFNTVYANTGPDGRFQFRITRYFVSQPTLVPDTFSIYVIAQVVPAPPGPNSLAVDSALVHVELAPAGSVPTPGTVVINVRYP